MAHFVVIGASLTGAKAVETLRSEGADGRITLIGEETERPYERPPLSKDYLLGKAPLEKAYVHDENWYAAHDVELRLATRATGLDPAAHTVTLDGVESLPYDKLLLATGSRVRRLDVPGADLAGVRYLRTMDESEALLEQLRGRGQVVVLGAGWIGLEVAAAARSHGCEVTVVTSGNLPLRRILGDEVATVVRDLHEANGVSFRFNASVRELRGESGHVRAVVLDDGTELPAGQVVVGIGIQPNTELAVAGGLRVENGVVTDSSLRTSDPDVYAAGDVAYSHNPLLGRSVRVEHWANALNGGPVAARAMLGQPVVYDRVPYFFTDQYDLGMEYSGYANLGEFDRVVFRGAPSVADGFVVFWTRDERVRAGMNVNIWDVNEDVQNLVRAGYGGRAVDLTRLADASVPLRDVLA
jgi:3-phenylpropionate/trans-cinnamate dioxygenase ferredoxin reductase component